VRYTETCYRYEINEVSIWLVQLKRRLINEVCLIHVHLLEDAKNFKKLITLPQ